MLTKLTFQQDVRLLVRGSSGRFYRASVEVKKDRAYLVGRLEMYSYDDGSAVLVVPLLFEGQQHYFFPDEFSDDVRDLCGEWLKIAVNHRRLANTAKWRELDERHAADIFGQIERRLRRHGQAHLRLAFDSTRQAHSS